MQPEAAVIEALEPTLASVITKTSLKWIFVGGKGGVGKTTCSSALAIRLAAVRPSVLIISTDPAHNLSDAFDQKFSKEPSLVKGFNNLFAMEIDPTVEIEEEVLPGASQALFHDLAAAIPGIDEAMSFAEVMKLVQSMEFSVIVFDTAPTGHTLRLLQFPSVLEKSLGKFMGPNSKFGALFKQMSGLLGMGGAAGSDNEEALTGKLEATKNVIEEVNKQFKNPDMTTFVCVCIPEFLSLFETERLVQELSKFQIDVQNIVINQVLFPEKESQCGLCSARQKMQQKYIDQIYDLYELFHITKLPLLKSEVRGVDALRLFSQFLIKPFTGTLPS